jgi:hypothetical protein
VALEAQGLFDQVYTDIRYLCGEHTVFQVNVTRHSTPLYHAGGSTLLFSSALPLYSATLTTKLVTIDASNRILNSLSLQISGLKTSYSMRSYDHYDCQYKFTIDDIDEFCRDVSKKAQSKRDDEFTKIFEQALLD